MNLLLWASTAFGSVHAPGAWLVADTQNFSVVNLDDEQIFERRDPEKGIAFARPESRMSVEAGGNSSMGNVGTSVLYSRFYAHHRWDWNRFSVKGRAEFGQSIIDQNGDGTINDFERAAGFERTSQHFEVDGRYDRFIGRLNSVYVLGGWMNDPFTGYLRRLHGQSGYSRFIVESEEHELVSETGFDVALERYVDEVYPRNDRVYSARGFMGWTVTVADIFQVNNSVESFLNVENTDDIRVKGEVALSMKATNILSVKTSYFVEHATLPVEGFRKTDQTMAFTLVASVFGFPGSRRN
jgi:putative salt-induced outer membrane protein YdiY